MKKTNYFILLGISAAAGAAAGMLSNRKEPRRGGIIGAAMGLLAGSAAAGLYERMAEDNDGITYYSESSPLYEDSEDVAYL